LDSEFGYEVDGPHVNVIPEELIILKLYWFLTFSFGAWHIFIMYKMQTYLL
jgi:hypothetical protein